MNLTKYEQETIINYNQEEDAACCYTHDRTLIHKLDALCQKYPTITVVREGDGFKEYSFPRKWVTIKTPRQLSDEQRAKAAERARHNFSRKEAQNNGRNEQPDD